MNCVRPWIYPGCAASKLVALQKHRHHYYRSLKKQYKFLWISLILRFSKLTAYLSNKSRQLFNSTLPVTPKRRGWHTSCKIALCHTVDACDARWPLLTFQWARPNYCRQRFAGVDDSAGIFNILMTTFARNLSRR